MRKRTKISLLAAVAAAGLAVASVPAPVLAESTRVTYDRIWRDPRFAGLPSPEDPSDLLTDEAIAICSAMRNVTWDSAADFASVRACDNAFSKAELFNTVFPPPPPDPERFSYIVALDRHSPTSPDAFARSLETQGIAVTDVYRFALRGVAAWMTMAEASSVASHPDVAFLQFDQIHQGGVDQVNPPNWGLDRIDQRALPLNNRYSYNVTGSGVTAYILDTGIRATHSDFGGRVAPGFDAYDPAGGPSPGDCHGHGTHVAGIVGGAAHGVAKAVNLVPVRVLDCSNWGTTAAIVDGYDFAVQDHLNAGTPGVVNYSIWGPVDAAIETAVEDAKANGLTVVVIAGNNNADACNYSPGRVASNLTIGATTNTDARWANSNFGDCVDWFAPGAGITSAGIANDTATAVMSGTSMAAPHVAGVAAQYLQIDPTASHATVSLELRNRLTQNVVTGSNSAPNHDLVYSKWRVRQAAGGHITITNNGSGPTFVVTGVYATDFSCALTNSPVEVTCTANPNPDIEWMCTHFILTARAPAPGSNVPGYVHGRVKCDYPPTLRTADVNGSGTQTADNTVAGMDLGTAYVVKCRAAGIGSLQNPSGSYQVDCYEPGLAWPLFG